MTNSIRNSIPDLTNSRLRFLLAAFAWLAVALPAYFQMFSGFSVWDDEGYLLATVKAVVDHHVLYNQIYTLYGPFYYLVEWLFYAVTGFAPSHDCVRFIGWFLWPTCTVLLAWPVFRVTRSLVLSAFTLVAIMRMLIFFQWSPGHPEEICLTLLGCLIVCLTGITRIASLPRMAAFGALCAALCQTKINLGVYVTLAVLLVLFAGFAGWQVAQCASGTNRLCFVTPSGRDHGAAVSL